VSCRSVDAERPQLEADRVGMLAAVAITAGKNTPAASVSSFES